MGLRQNRRTEILKYLKIVDVCTREEGCGQRRERERDEGKEVGGGITVNLGLSNDL